LPSNRSARTSRLRCFSLCPPPGFQLLLALLSGTQGLVPRILGAFLLDLPQDVGAYPELPGSDHGAHLASPHAAAAPAKGRLMRCTVFGLTPNRAAILRTPSVRPGLSRAARMAFSRSAAIGGRPRRVPSSLARARPARTRSWIIARSNWHVLLHHLEQ